MSNTIKIKRYMWVFFLRASKVISKRHAKVTASHAVKIKIKKVCVKSALELDCIDKLNSNVKSISHTNSLKKKNLFKSEIQLNINIKHEASIR